MRSISHLQSNERIFQYEKRWINGLFELDIKNGVQLHAVRGYAGLAICFIIGNDVLNDRNGGSLKPR
jgi:hypothetical protein